MIPKPGMPARGTRTGRPVVVLFDLLGRRMALRILWELWRAGLPMTFRELQRSAETNPALLNVRLKELRAARLLTPGPDGYVLTNEGRSLALVLLPVSKWASKWAGEQRL